MTSLSNRGQWYHGSSSSPLLELGLGLAGALPLESFSTMSDIESTCGRGATQKKYT
jgi:hypothetical protein